MKILSLFKSFSFGPQSLNLAAAVIAITLTAPCGVVNAQEGAQWIWSTKKDKARPNETVYFARSFSVDGKVKSAKLYITCDNGFTAWLNGQKVAQGTEWEKPVSVDVSKHIRNKGLQRLSIQGSNDSGTVAGLLVDLKLTLNNGKKLSIQSDPKWTWTRAKSAGWNKAKYDTSSWSKAVASGAYGVSPWGKVGAASKPSAPGSGISSSGLEITKGFKVQKIYDVPKSTQGSWVSLAVGPDGKLIASDQGKMGLFEIDVDSNGNLNSVEKIPVNLSGAQGLQWAFNSLYVHVNGKGLYRAFDKNNDNELDTVEQLQGPNGGGEHGNHAVILTEDNQDLYVVAGNHTNVPGFIKKSRIDMDWNEDLLLPRQWDARGHARGRLAPGGWVARIDEEAKDWEIVSIGYRNQYDVAINRHGDMFTYDADMEWDMGSPWYRPTRICHVTSGSEFGWRSGTGKWPSYFEDSLPPTVDIGPGCPTGVVFGTGAKFPAKYQDALYVLDWTFGTIYAIHLKPDGASYTATTEEFLTGSPFPVTDAIVGHDGALYITVGGRGTQSALYRVTYTGPESTAPATGGLDADTRMARSKRLRLEQWHRPDAPPALKYIWPELSSNDRFIRYAARIALEHQPVASWKEKAFSASDNQTIISSMIAWARQGDTSDYEKALKALLSVDVEGCSKQEILGLLRAYSLCFIRHGEPSAEFKGAITNHLHDIEVNNDRDLQTEWVRLNVYLDGPDVVEKALAFINDDQQEQIPSWGDLIARNARYGGTISQMLSNMPPSSKIYIAFHLRNVEFGWTIDQRKAYFDFLAKASTHSGGASYRGFIDNIRKDALAKCSESELAALKDLNSGQPTQVAVFKSTPPKGPGRAWTLEAAVSAVNAAGSKPDFDSGRNLFHATACSACHLFAGEGGAIGPDLSSVRNKFSVNDLVESIIDPSKVISDQYGSSILNTKSGAALSGRVISRTGDDNKVSHYEVYSADPEAKPAVVKASDVKSIEESPVSQMPPGLINSLNPSEVKDLVAYLLSRGNKNDPLYK